MAKKKTKTFTNENSQAYYISLIKYAFLLILFLSPLLRGLYFEPQLFSVAFLIGVLYLLYIWKAQAVNLDKLDILFLSLAGSYALSMVNAASLRGSYLGFIRYLLYFLCFYFIRNNIDSDKGKKELAKVYIAAISVMTMLTLLTKAKVLDISSAVINNRLAGTVEYSNTYAVLLVACLVLIFTLYGNENTFGNKQLAAWGSLLAYLNATALFATLSRGGFLIYLFMLAITLLLSKDRIALITYLIIVNILAVVSSVIILRNEGIAVFAVLLIGGILAAVMKKYLAKVPGKILGVCAGVFVMLGTVVFVLNFDKTPLKRLLELDFTNQSVYIRYVFYRDALKIFLDNWLIGTGGGGWELLYGQYQSFYYTSKLVHSSMVQSLVEVGLVGTSIFLIAVCLVVIKLMRRKDKTPGDKAFFLAFLTILLHSLIDFDLSIPAVPILMFTAMGAVAGPSEPAIKGIRTKIGLMLVSGIMLVSVSGMGIASFSAKAVLNNGTVADLEAFKNTMSMATKLDPFNTTYHTYLGQAYISEGVQENDNILIEKGLNYYNKAIKLEPNSYLTHMARGMALHKAGRFAEANSEYEQVIQIRPFHGTGYEYAMKNYLEQAVKNKDLTALDNILQVYDRAIQQMAEVPEAETIYIAANYKLNNLPELNKCAGIANSLLGDFAKGYEHFTIAQNNAWSMEDLNQSRAWLIAVSQRLDREINVTAEADKLEEAQDLINEFDR